MLRLENVSKFYSEGGLVSTGFSKVNLQFEIGEFVAITGESGSGKSTLLNVISGLDSYEEGEMFIMGDPTSGFSNQDLEDYRKKYIGNVFQSFNLVNSYTVYQNVELILLINGYKKEEIQGKIKDIISKVGLSQYEKTKVSKLSGGQKQRVAIARALAKETPIIVADEPTGNLDSQSAAEIIELLDQLSKDKLIVVVTHNYEQVEKYVTRKISMHDGRIAEDKSFTRDVETTKEKQEVKAAKADLLSFKNMVRLSGRNTFNIPAKFVLLLVVFLFLCAGTIAQYSSYLNMDDTASGRGWNEYFNYTGKDRILITRDDKKEFTSEDYEKLGSIANVKQIVKSDLSMDISGSINSDKDGFYISTKIKDASDYQDRLVEGRMPKRSNEIILLYDESNNYIAEAKDNVLKKGMNLINDSTGAELTKNKIKVVGFGYLTEDEIDSLHTGNLYQDAIIGLNTGGMDEIRKASLEGYCTQEIEFANSIVYGNSSMGTYPIVVSSKVPEGQVYIPEEIATMSQYNAYGQKLEITNISHYFKDKHKFTVGATYNKNTLEYYLGLTDYDRVSGNLFVNQKDYNTMFDKGNFQSSILVKDVKTIDETILSINDAGYNTFRVGDGLVNGSESYAVILKTFRTILLVIVLVVLFFITYFITKLILKSRNTYYATVRMIGGTKENCRAMLRTELFFVFNIAYLLCIIFAIFTKVGFIKIDYLVRVVSFLTPVDFIILYVILCVMVLILAGRYARALFKKSAMNAHREVV